MTMGIAEEKYLHASFVRRLILIAGELNIINFLLDSMRPGSRGLRNCEWPKFDHSAMLRLPMATILSKRTQLQLQKFLEQNGAQFPSWHSESQPKRTTIDNDAASLLKEWLSLSKSKDTIGSGAGHTGKIIKRKSDRLTKGKTPATPSYSALIGAVDIRLVRVFGQGDATSNYEKWVPLEVARISRLGWVITTHRWAEGIAQWVQVLTFLQEMLNRERVGGRDWACEDVEFALLGFAVERIKKMSL